MRITKAIGLRCRYIHKQKISMHLIKGNAAHLTYAILEYYVASGSIASQTIPGTNTLPWILHGSMLDKLWSDMQARHPTSLPMAIISHNDFARVQACACADTPGEPPSASPDNSSIHEESHNPKGKTTSVLILPLLSKSRFSLLFRLRIDLTLTFTWP